MGNELTMGLVIVGAFILAELIRLTLGYLFKKATAEDYIKKSDLKYYVKKSDDVFVKATTCTTCSKNGDDAVKRVEKELKTVKGILLMMAIKAGVDAEELKVLTE